MSGVENAKWFMEHMQNHHDRKKQHEFWTPTEDSMAEESWRRAREDVDSRNTWREMSTLEISRLTPEFLILATSWTIMLIVLEKKNPRTPEWSQAYNGEGEKKHNFLFTFRYNEFYLPIEALSGDIWSSEETHNGI